MSITNFLINNQVISLFLLIIILFLIWNIFLSLRLWSMKRRLKTLFNGKKASDLEEILFEEIKHLKKAEKDIKEFDKLLKTLKKMAGRSIQQIGLVRFNPFKDTGGDQSFAIALLDAHKNGLVISSLYSREGTRIYSKPIEAGQSKYLLSKEELEALKKAGVK